jgi:hypothetical protein
MNRINQEKVIPFAEVLSTARIGCDQVGRLATPDSHPMICFQGM